MDQIIAQEEERKERQLQNEGYKAKRYTQFKGEEWRELYCKLPDILEEADAGI